METTGKETVPISPKPWKRYPSEMINQSRAMECPLLVMGDSYKAGHFKMYKEAVLMTAYGEFREPMKMMGITDPRIVVYGMRHIIDQLVSRVINDTDLAWAKQFYSTHGVGNSEYDFPEEMFQKIVKMKHFPVKIDALPDGSVVLPHTPVFFITAKEEYSRFCTFLETVLTMIWYPSTVATLSKHTKCLIEKAFEETVDNGKSHYLLQSRLHDFGFRGCTCVEQSVIGGSAHLLNFDGSDTMSACFHVQHHLNNGQAVGTSIPATEHSVMTSYKNELDAILNLIKEYQGKTVACVMDSYNYEFALDTYLPEVKKVIGTGTFVIRPDSGDPVVQVLKALRAAEKAGFRCTANKRGYKVLHNVAVIQGDGINYQTVQEILVAVKSAGFSAENVAFGMGGGLLQKVDRDTMSFATKLCYVQFDEDGKNVRNVIKAPYDVPEKRSLPGRMQVMKRVTSGNTQHHTVFPISQVEEQERLGFENSMVTVYDNGITDTVFMTETFQQIRERLNSEWDQCKHSYFNNPEWGKPLHTTMIAVQEFEAEEVAKKNGDYKTDRAVLYADEKYAKINEVIQARVAAIASKKMTKSSVQNEGLEIFDDALARTKDINRKLKEAISALENIKNTTTPTMINPRV